MPATTSPSLLPVWAVPVRGAGGFEIVDMPGRDAGEARAAVGARLLGTGCFPIPGGRVEPSNLHPDHPARAATEAARRALGARGAAA